MNDDGDMVDKLTQWYRQPVGDELSVAIKQRLERYLPRLFGYYLVEFDRQWLGRCPVRHRYCYVESLESGGDVCGRYVQTPFATGSVDVVVLPHVLDFRQDWQVIVREMARILVSGGRLLILGFNRFNLWRLLGLSGALGVRRLRQGLLTEGFQIKQQERFFFRPPLKSADYLQKLLFLESLGERIPVFPGAAYLLLAQKNTDGLALIQMKKRRIRQYGAVVSPP